jgi:hypothetical protein
MSPNQASMSPLRLAISAVVALIPLPSVVNPSRPSHVALRRKYGHQLVQRCLTMIEDETDIPDSPSTALAYGTTVPQRQPLHPHVPIELEGVLSLCLLAIYEYSQRGNIRKMQDRAGQALMSAMNMSLHSQIDSDILFAEAKRRAWWMTVSYLDPSLLTCAWSKLILSAVYLLVSSFYSELYCESIFDPGFLKQRSADEAQPPTLLPNDPRFTTPYPQMVDDSEVSSQVKKPSHSALTLHARSGLFSLNHSKPFCRRHNSLSR